MSERELLGRALAIIDPAERAAFLDHACAANANLRARLDALLAGHAAHSQERLPIEPARTDPSSLLAMRATGDVNATIGTNPDAQSDTSESPASALGSRIGGRYTLVDLIGEGGMGSVYRAEQSEPVKRQVAVKLIRFGTDSKGVLARFDAERQALALMDHPNIAKIYDGGVTPAGQPYFVMELVQGIPITDYCDQKRLPVAARLQLFVAVCQAVQHAHQKGIIHRDLKPANVLVTEVDGKPTPKVIDFGVAKATEQKLTDQSFLDAGAIVGTPAYMSPEQADPTTEDIDTRTDVYALGVILYELLTGSPPIEANQLKRGAVLEMLRMVREVEPPKPSTKVSTTDALPSIAATRSVEPAQLKRALHGDLDWIVMKAIEKDRSRRYETANGFAADVLRHLSHEPVVAAPPSRAYRVRKFIRKNRGLVTAASVVALALLVGFAGTAWGWLEAKRQEQLARDEANEKELARREEELARSEEAKQRQRADVTVTDMLASRGQLAADRDAQAEAALWFTAAADQAEVALDPARRDFNRVRARNALSLAPIPVAVVELSKLPNNNETCSVEFVPGGDTLSVRIGQWRSYFWSWRDGKIVSVGHHEKSPSTGPIVDKSALCFSPDGAFVARGFPSGDLQVRRVSDGLLVGSERVPGAIHSLAYSPDGRVLAVGSNPVRFWDAKSQTVLKATAAHDGPVIAMTFNRAGTRLITVSGDRARVFATDSDRPALEPLFPPLPHFLTAPPVVTSDDRALVTIDGGFCRWNLSTGKVLSQPTRRQVIDPTSVLAPNGNWLATVVDDGKRVSLLGADDAQPMERPSHRHWISGLRFNSTGDLLLSSSSDGSARLWSVSDGKPVGPSLEHNGGWVQGCAWSADDRFLATIQDGVVRIWRRPDPATTPVVDGWGKQPRLSLDGRLVVPGCWHEAPDRSTSQVVRQLCVVNCDSGKASGPVIALSGELIDACVGTDNRSVAAAWIGAKLGVWDVATATPLFPAIPLPADASSIAARPGHPDIAVLCRNGDALVVDARTGQTTSLNANSEKKSTTITSRIRYTPDGRSLVIGEFGFFLVYDTDTGKLRFPRVPLTEGFFTTFAISADSRYLVSACNKRNEVVAQVWDLQTGRAVSQPLSHPGGIVGLFSVRFSPDGRFLLTGHRDGQVRYWDWRAGQLACPPMVHSDEVYDAAITPDGRFAVTAIRGRPWRIEVGELTTGKRIAAPVRLPRNPAFGCARLAITPDGRRVLVTSQDRELAVVDLDSLLAAPPVSTPELKRQAEVAISHRLEAGDLNRLPLADWKLRWSARPDRGPQPAWLVESDSLLVPKPVFDETLLFLDRRLKRRPDDIGALFHRLGLLSAQEDRSKLKKLCLKRWTNDRDEEAAAMLSEVLIDSANSPVRWSRLNPVEMTAQSGTMLMQQPEGWILAKVTTFATGTYRIRADSTLRRITALRLDVMPHKSLPGSGSGSDGGNFHLTGVRAFRQRPGQASVPLTIVSAEASFSRAPKFGPLAVLDGSPVTRWDVYPNARLPQWLQLSLSEPVTLTEGEQVVVELESLDKSWYRNHLGHFRLSVAEEEPSVWKSRLSRTVRSLDVSPPLQLAAATLAFGETDLARDVLAGFASLRGAQDHLVQPLLQLAVFSRLDEPRQAKEAYDRLLTRLREHAVPESLRPWVIETMMRMGGIALDDAERNLARLGFEAEIQIVMRADRTARFRILEMNRRQVLRAAALLAWLKCDKEYQAMRDRLLDVAEFFQDADMAEEVVEACCLMPVTGTQLEAVLTLARRAVTLDRGASNPWRQLSLGMAQYRNGQFAQAIDTLTAAAADDPNNTVITTTSAFYRAMSLFQLGKKDEARGLAVAAARAMTPPPDDPGPRLESEFYSLVTWLAHREAKELIQFEDAETQRRKP